MRNFCMEIIQYVLVQRSLVTFLDMCQFNAVKCNLMSSQAYEKQLFWSAVLFCELCKDPIFLGGFVVFHVRCFALVWGFFSISSIIIFCALGLVNWLHPFLFIFYKFSQFDHCIIPSPQHVRLMPGLAAFSSHGCSNLHLVTQLLSWKNSLQMSILYLYRS